MTNQTQYETHANGSINYDFYLQNSAEIRSADAHAAVAAVWAWLKSLVQRAPASQDEQPHAAPLRAGRPAIRNPRRAAHSDMAKAERATPNS